MTDRILSLIKYFNLSPSDFAEEIGVQRSSISHLISGRNKPSLEFVQKILNRFKEINPEWVLSGSGEMIKNGITPESVNIPFQNSGEKITEVPKEHVKRESPKVTVKKRAVETDDRQVEKIIYLYRDKTFREYYPE